jgi:transposase-like protein
MGEVKNVSVLATTSARTVIGRSWRRRGREGRSRLARLPALPEGSGPSGARLIISDKCLGLVEAATEFYPEARWQRCVVHWYRNIFSDVPTTKVKEVAAMLKAIHAQEDAAAEAKARSSHG